MKWGFTHFKLRRPHHAAPDFHEQVYTHALGGVSGVASFITTEEQLQ